MNDERPKDEEWWRCADTIVGQRCAKPGAMSHGTHGGGPWYCAGHFYQQIPTDEHRPAPEVMAHIRDVLRPVARDAEADAERAAMQAE